MQLSNYFRDYLKLKLIDKKPTLDTVKRDVIEMVKNYNFSQEQAVFIVDHVWRLLGICEATDDQKEIFPVSEFFQQISETMIFAKTYPWK